MRSRFARWLPGGVRAGRRAPPGAAPGTLVVDEDAPPPEIVQTVFSADRIEERSLQDPDDLRGDVPDGSIDWIHVTGLGDAVVLQRLAEQFGLHQLVIEDVVNVSQSAKVEEYEDSLFVVLRLPRDRSGERTDQLSLFVAGDRLVSFAERPAPVLEPIRRRLRAGRRRIRSSGPGYLAYALIDAVIDSYLPFVEGYGEELERVEDEIVEGRRSDAIGRIHEVRRELLGMQRIVTSMRDAVQTLQRIDTPVIEESTRIFLRDCLDHATHLRDLVTSYRELGTGLMDLHLSLLSQRMNDVMRVLTVIATIFIPLTFVAGIYGMNFTHDTSPWAMPELRWYWGYPAVLAVMGAAALALVGYFRWKRWL